MIKSTKVQKLIRVFLCLSLISTSLIIYNKNQQEIKFLSEMNHYRELGLFPRDLIQNKLNEINQEKEYQQMVNSKRKEIVEYLKSDTYKKKQTIIRLKEQTGLHIIDIIPTTFKTTAYSSLPEENGGWNITCNGQPLEGKIVANNTLPQYSKILLGNEIYTVADKGSSRFNNTSRLDVLIERKSGESDNQYRQRVSNYGVQNIQGYILKIKE